MDHHRIESVPWLSFPWKYDDDGLPQTSTSLRTPPGTSASVIIAAYRDHLDRSRVPVGAFEDYQIVILVRSAYMSVSRATSSSKGTSGVLTPRMIW